MTPTPAGPQPEPATANFLRRFEEWAEYRKTATVYARQCRDGETVSIETLEGPATAEPGDWVLVANTPRGEQWIVRADVFAATYEPADPAPPAGSSATVSAVQPEPRGTGAATTHVPSEGDAPGPWVDLRWAAAPAGAAGGDVEAPTLDELDTAYLGEFNAPFEHSEYVALEAQQEAHAAGLRAVADLVAARYRAELGRLRGKLDILNGVARMAGVREFERDQALKLAADAIDHYEDANGAHVYGLRARLAELRAGSAPSAPRQVDGEHHPTTNRAQCHQYQDQDDDRAHAPTVPVRLAELRTAEEGQS